MKKSFLMIAPAATAVVLALGMTFTFAGCANSDVKSEIEETEKAIDFDEVINKTTRAEITNEADLNTAGGFKVWGYKAKTTGLDWSTSEKTPIFDATVVSGGDGAWTYTGTKYWDKTCKYKFFAGGPVNHTNGTLSWANDIFSVSGAKSALASNSLSDFVIDRIANIEDGATHTTTASKVELDFHHIMAKVDFKVKKAEGINDKVVLTSLKMTGWNNEDGNFTQNKFDGTWATLDVSEWLQTPSTAGKTAELADNNTLETTAVALDKDYIMVPQEIGANTLKFTATFTIGEGGSAEEFSDQIVAVADAQTWGTDSHTTYTLTIGPKAIEFEVNSICGFDAKDATNPVTID